MTAQPRPRPFLSSSRRAPIFKFPKTRKRLSQSDRKREKGTPKVTNKKVSGLPPSAYSFCGTLKRPQDTSRKNSWHAPIREPNCDHEHFLSSSLGAPFFKFGVHPDAAQTAPSTQWNTENTERFLIWCAIKCLFDVASDAKRFWKIMVVIVFGPPLMHNFPTQRTPPY